MNVVIVGARERTENDRDRKTVEDLLQNLMTQYGNTLHVMSVGCDKGVGKVTREYCIANKVVFAEVRVKFEGEDIKRAFFAHVFLARNKTLLDVGDEYYIFKGPSPNGIIEGLIEPAKTRVGEQRVKVYDLS